MSSSPRRRLGSRRSLVVASNDGAARIRGLKLSLPAASQEFAPDLCRLLDHDAVA